MTATTRVALAIALLASEKLIDLLRPACARIAIAGSVRRRKPDVKDLEIVAVPLGRWDGLFGADEIESINPFEQEENQLDHLVEKLIRKGSLDWDGELRRRGQRYKRLRFEGLPVDLFCVEADSFGYQLAIRTGPEGFSKRLGTQRRFHGELPNEFACRDGALWFGAKRIAVPTEGDFFSAIEMPWVEPEDRR